MPNICPCCTNTTPSSARDETQWRKHLSLDEVAEHVYNVYKHCQVMRSLFNTPVLTLPSDESRRVASDGYCTSEYTCRRFDWTVCTYLHLQECKKSDGTTYDPFETSGHSVTSQKTRKRRRESPQISHKLYFRFTNKMDTCVIVEKRIPNAGNVKMGYWTLSSTLVFISATTSETEANQHFMYQQWSGLHKRLLQILGTADVANLQEQPTRFFQNSSASTEYVCTFDVGSYTQAASRKT
jgi:hypothetical protein